MSIGCFLVLSILRDYDARIPRSGEILSHGPLIAIILTTETIMAQLIVPDLDDAVEQKLLRRAARRGRSMEQEVRDILHDAVRDDSEGREGVGTEIAELFKGIELEDPIPELKIELQIPKFD
jgi:plasmid stability protein